MTVQLDDAMGDDQTVIRRAKVSTLGSAALEAEGGERFINFLMRDRHGSPFEHCYMTFYIEAPIFVWREFMRHRIASYNEESGRYKELKPVFYIPNDDRKLVQVGKAGAYTFESGTVEQLDEMQTSHMAVSRFAYEAYQDLLNIGIAREVARISLPLNIYSSAFVTMNLRSLMNFLSLRTKDLDAAFPSFPQREIEMVAEEMEWYFQNQFPMTHHAFGTNRRVAP